MSMANAKRNVEFEMGRRGQARREELGMTREELAERLRCSYKNVSLLELDGAGTLRVVRRWAEALEMDPSELAFGTTQRKD